MDRERDRRVVVVPELEGPEEVVGLLESRADGVDLVDEVLHADDVVLAEGLRDDLVLGQGDALLVDLAEAALVDQLADGLQGGLAVGDVGLDGLEHGHGGEVDLEEGGVVDLAQAQQLQDLLALGVHAHDTADADDKEDLGHVLDEVVAVVLGLALGADQGTLVVAVLLDVLLSTLEDLLAGGLVLLGESNARSLAASLDLIKSLALLQEGFRNFGTAQQPQQGEKGRG